VVTISHKLLPLTSHCRYISITQIFVGFVIGLRFPIASLKIWNWCRVALKESWNRIPMSEKLMIVIFSLLSWRSISVSATRQIIRCLWPTDRLINRFLTETQCLSKDIWSAICDQLQQNQGQVAFFRALDNFSTEEYVTSSVLGHFKKNFKYFY
jgi:hypothetical protein